MDSVAVYLLATVLGSSVLASLITGWFLRRSRAAEVESLQVTTAAKVVALTAGQFDEFAKEISELKLQVLDLERRLNESDTDREFLRRQLGDLHDHIDELEAQMRKHGIDPPPRPRTRKHV